MRAKATYTVTDENRDKGKIFLLTEMPASKAESWAMRAILALMNDVKLPEGIGENMSMAAMAEIGIQALAKLKWEVAEPLLDEMWQCIQVCPDPSKPFVVRPLIEEDIEEITTRIKLREEVWKLHTGFLPAVGISKSGASTAKKTGPNTKTSRQ